LKVRDLSSPFEGESLLAGRPSGISRVFGWTFVPELADKIAGRIASGREA
jgi:hypothetical protein